MKASTMRIETLILSSLVPVAGCSDSMGLSPGESDAATTADSAMTADVDTMVDAEFDGGADVAVTTDASDAANFADRAVDDGAGAQDTAPEAASTCATRCASGVCDSNGDCRGCVKDEECLGGRVCGHGVCGARCGSAEACAAPFVCCDEHCVDTTIDAKNCGMCGAACTATQFCATASPSVCQNEILANICRSKKMTFLLDGLQADQEAMAVLQAALSARCLPPPVVTMVSQSASTAINTTTGQPVVGGGELLAAVGGDSTQRLVNFLEDSGATRIYNEYDGLNTTWFKSRDANQTVLATISMSTLTPTHDYFLVEVVLDPISSTSSLVLYGLGSPGSQAGAYYFANTILPSIATYTKSWYLYEWMGLNPDGGAGASDTFTLLASGQ